MLNPFNRKKSPNARPPSLSKVTSPAELVEAPLAMVTQNGPLIELRDVQKAYKTPAGEFMALKGIDLTIQKGEFVAVQGKSGAGKSTLINMITGIDQPSAGQICIGNHAIHAMGEEDIAKWRGYNAGVIFQFFQLLPMLTCAQNVMMAMDFANLYNTPKERYQRAVHLLDQVGIPEQADKLPSAVSGGQRQRVAIARALANDPSFIAADEPTGSLDSHTAAAVFQVFEQLVDNGATILMMTHDRELASRVNRVLTIADGRLLTQ